MCRQRRVAGTEGDAPGRRQPYSEYGDFHRLGRQCTFLSYPSDPRGAFQGAVRACEAPLFLAEFNERRHYSMVALIGTAASAPPKVHAWHDVGSHRALVECCMWSHQCVVGQAPCLQVQASVAVVEQDPVCDILPELPRCRPCSV